MNVNTFSQTFLGEVNHLLRIYLTVPMSSATAERTFSCLKRLEYYLRSIMTKKGLNNVTLMHTHRVDKLDLLDIAMQFICCNDRCRIFFGQY